MLTNIIAYLHTTFAYQSAAMQLMVGQASFDAQQLNLRETVPIVAPASTNDWEVAMPPYGVTGLLKTSNYIYGFSAGKLTSIQIKTLPHSAAERGPSLIDTNGAYQLAHDWLAALSVDVSALEAKYPHTIQFAASGAARSLVENGPSPGGVPGRSRSSREGWEHDRRTEHQHGVAATNHVTHFVNYTNNVRLPVFRITWGGRDPQSRAAHLGPQVSVEILGSTKQCLDLHILTPDLLKSPPLAVNNADALLGPLPPPEHYIEELLGGKAAYDTVARPDRVSVWLVGSSPDDPSNLTNRTSAVALSGPATAGLSRALADFNSYSWIRDKACAPDYGVRLQFTKGADVVDFAWSDTCDHLQVTHNGATQEKDCDAARGALVSALKSAFPNDETIKTLSPTGPTQPQ